MSRHESISIRMVLAFIWLITAALAFGGYSLEHSLELLAPLGLHGALALTALYTGAALDALMGLACLLWPQRSLWLLQAAIILGYSVIIALFLPEFWLHPFGPVLKNTAVLCLLWLLYRHAGEPA